MHCYESGRRAKLGWPEGISWAGQDNLYDAKIWMNGQRPYFVQIH
jgi:hypothetical protein